MTLFEYLAVSFSLVFSFSAMRLMSGLPYALDPDRRYYVHILHVFLILFATAGLFWTFWSVRDVQWNWMLFLSALAGPSLLYFLACTLVPDSPSTVTSWRNHFYEMRKRYFLGICGWALLASINATTHVGLPLFHPLRLQHLLLLILGIVGFATDNPRVHGLITIVGLLLGVVVSVVFYLPGSFAA